MIGLKIKVEGTEFEVHVEGEATQDELLRMIGVMSNVHAKLLRALDSGPKNDDDLEVVGYRKGPKK